MLMEAKIDITFAIIVQEPKQWNSQSLTLKLKFKVIEVSDENW